MCSPDPDALDLLTDVLASGASSRFFRKLLKDKRLVSEIDCAQTGYLDPGLVIVDGKPAEGVTLEQMEAAIWEELELIQNEPIAEDELQKLKNRIESQQVFGDVGAMNKAMNLAFYELVGNAELINKEIEHYQAIQVADIQRVAKTIFRKENASILYYKAKK